jgi:Plasmid pRiA4b ORF-3-like protein
MAAMATTKRARAGSQTVARRTIHTIKVTLRNSRPPIWRRLEVPSSSTLLQLHDVIQDAFGWGNYHMWAFETGAEQYGVPDPDLEIRNAASKRLGQVAPRAGDKLGYTYDFGDDWEHDIVVEGVAAAKPGVAYPRCLTGRRAGPPEDCGGIWGYAKLLEILADPAHEDHKEHLEWLGLTSADEFDPAAFDLDEINSALSPLATVLVKG